MAQAPSFCPHCGFDLQADQPIATGRAKFTSAEGLFIRGSRVSLTVSERIVVQSLMKAGGGVVSRNALLERVGAEGCDRVIDTFVKRIRTKMRPLGGGDLIKAEYGLGYSWRDTA